MKVQLQTIHVRFKVKLFIYILGLFKGEYNVIVSFLLSFITNDCISVVVFLIRFIYTLYHLRSKLNVESVATHSHAQIQSCTLLAVLSMKTLHGM